MILNLKATKIEEVIAKTFLWISVLVTLISLFAIMFHILKQGIGVISWEFLTQYP